MKTGVMIEANLNGLNLENISVKRIFNVENPSEWENDKDFNLESANKLIDLMVEGIITVIMNCHDSKIEDSAVMYRETLDKLLQSFSTPCRTNITDNQSAELLFKANEVNSSKIIKGDDMLTSISLKEFGRLNRNFGLAIGTIESLLSNNELSEETKSKLKNVLLKIDDTKAR